jgi:hypothetical protein
MEWASVNVRMPTPFVSFILKRLPLDLVIHATGIVLCGFGLFSNGDI